MNQHSANELIKSLYLVSSGLEEIQSFLDKVSRAFKSHIVFGIALDPITNLFSSPSYVGVDQKVIEDFYGYYAEKNVLVQAGMPDLLRGKVVDGDDYVPRSELIKTEYYCDYLRKVGAEHNIGFTSPYPSGLLYTMFISRDKAGGCFNSEEKLLAEIIKPHFETAFQVERHVKALEHACTSKSYALDQLNTGVCFLGEKLELLEVNSNAKEFLIQSEALVSQGGYLSAGKFASPQLIKLLHEMSTGALRANRQIKICQGNSCLKQCVAVFPARDPEELGWLDTSGTRYILFIGANLTPSQKCISILQNEFSMTEKELELIKLLVCGKSLNQSASILEVSTETIRSHVKHIFMKMGVHSQAQLVIQVSQLNSVI